MSLEFCQQAGCLEFAQNSNPMMPNLLKGYCVAHERAARARGETGERRPVPKERFFHEGAPPNPDGAFEIADAPRGRPRKNGVHMPAKRAVKRLDTGFVFASVRSAATEIGASLAGVKMALREGRPIKGISLVYADETGESLQDQIERVPVDQAKLDAFAKTVIAITEEPAGSSEGKRFLQEGMMLVEPTPVSVTEILAAISTMAAGNGLKLTNLKITATGGVSVEAESLEIMARTEQDSRQVCP